MPALKIVKKLVPYKKDMRQKKLYALCLFALFFFLPACTYQFGSGSGSKLAGNYYLENFGNNTAYLNLELDLQNEVQQVLKRQKGVRLTKAEEADTLLFGRIVEVRKTTREISPQGQVLEQQIEILFSLVIEKKGAQKSEQLISNRGYRNNSGVVRLDRGGNEGQALKEAAKDLAEMLSRALSGSNDW